MTTSLPQRLVSLTCSNTEIVCALGLADRLVGVDDHSDHPEDVVARLPRVGPDLSVDPAKVAALEPDLVLASLTVPGHEKVVESIDKTGIPHLEPSPESLEDVFTNIEQIAQVLGVPERGRQLVQQMRAALSPRSLDEAPTILIEWWPRPVIAAGRRTWVHDLIELAGGRNAMAHRDVLSEPLGDELEHTLDPDALVLCWCGVHVSKYRSDVVKRRAGWSGKRVVQREAIFPIGEPYLGRPGPRLVEGYRALSRVVDEVLAAR